jgi:hypothetical protein
LWASLAAGAIPAHAQHCLSLTGTWNLNMSKSMFGTDKIPTQQPERETLTILRIPTMSISHSDLMPIRTERSDAGLSQGEIVIDIGQAFGLLSLS